MAADFTTIVFFGDSLSDSDEFDRISGELIVDPLPTRVAGWDGQWSNGPVFVEYMSSFLGVPYSDADNYAVAGATALGHETVADIVEEEFPVRTDEGDLYWPVVFPEGTDLSTVEVDGIPLTEYEVDLEGQVDRFLQDAETASSDLSSAAASVFIGLNDLMHFEPTSVRTAVPELRALMNDVGQKIEDEAGRLAEAGFGTIILYEMPEADFFPAFDEVGPLLGILAQGAVRQFNDDLRDHAANLERDHGVDVEIVQFHYLSDVVLDDPRTHGLWETEEPIILGTASDITWTDVKGDGYDHPVPTYTLNPDALGVNPDEATFYDNIHPTTAMHAILGIFAAESLTSEVFLFGDGPDSLSATAGDDMAWGSGGRDRFALHAGDDSAFGGLGSDAVAGGSGSDLLSGGDAGDRLRGGSGEDLVSGDAGNDFLHGGRGDDIVLPGLGSDTAHGGLGDDLFLYWDPTLAHGSLGTDADSLSGGAGQDVAILFLSPEMFGLVAAELAAAQGDDIDLPTLGLSLTSVDTVHLFQGDDASDGVAAFDLELTAALGDRLMEAEAWGLV